MGIGTSMFLLAAGAMLKWAVTFSVAGVKLETVGVILMVVGALGLVLSLIRASTLARRRRAVAFSDPRYLN
jgi:hypothetical protein